MTSDCFWKRWEGEKVERKMKVRNEEKEKCGVMRRRGWG
jgi:hypothetical protein